MGQWLIGLLGMVISLNVFATPSFAAASPDGSKIPGMTSITDADGNVWTVSGGKIYETGTTAPTIGTKNVSELHLIGNIFYQKNSSNHWYIWDGSHWIATTDPLVPSANTTTIGSTGHIIDSLGEVWSIQNGILYVDGFRADGNYNTTTAVYDNSTIYCENTSSEWYEWTTNQKWVRTTNPVAPIANAKYLSQLGAKCDGSDDSAAVASAIANAANNAYTLVVDCAATLNIGLNVDKAIFIGDGTNITFEGNGKFFVNNLFVPAFVIANSSDITLNNWTVLYTATWQSGTDHAVNEGMPVSFSTGGYYLGGVWHASAATGLNINGAGVFNDTVYTSYLEKNKGIQFTGCAGESTQSGAICRALWTGSINESAVFFIAGETDTVQINNLTLQAATLTDVTKYMPFAFMFATGFKSNQTVTDETPFFNAANAHDYYATPNNITFNGVTLDGYMMGFQGALSNSKFQNIKALHYSDLQDSNGDNVGGVAAGSPLGTTMPPPHLFYLDDMLGVVDTALANTNVTIENVTDAFDPSAAKPISLRGPNSKFRQVGGYADAIKIQCNSCAINGFTSYRPDGFMSIMATNKLTVSNVTVNYNSILANNNYQEIQGITNHWHAVRTTTSVANEITFTNVTLNDMAATTSTTTQDITGTDLLFTDVTFSCTQWSGSGNFAAGMPGGSTSNSSIEFVTKSPASDVTLH